MSDKWHIASVSFGKDSLAMLLLILDGEGQYPLDEVVFFDWGMEFQAIYNNRDKLIPILQKKGIKFTELHYPTSFMYNFCEREVRKKNGAIQNGYSWCGGRTRWGTDRKQSTIKKYYKTINKEIVEYIGIAADEFERIPRARAKGQILPLVDTNMTEKDALDFCYKKGYNWLEGNIDLYDIMDRVSCWCCKNNNLKELRNMYHYLPEYWGKLKDMQNKTLFPYKNYTYKGTSYGTIEDLEYRFYCEDNNKEWIF